MSAQVQKPLAGAIAAMLYLSCSSISHACDAVVSSSSVALAQRAAPENYSDVVVAIALENFSIAPAEQPGMQPFLRPLAGTRDSDPQVVATQLTAGLRAMCLAFSGSTASVPAHSVGSVDAADTRQTVAADGHAVTRVAATSVSSQSRASAARQGNSQSLRDEEPAKLAERVACTAYSINPAGKQDDRLRNQCDPLSRSEAWPLLEAERGKAVDELVALGAAQGDPVSPSNEEVQRQAEVAAEQAVLDRLGQYWIPPVAESRDQVERNLYLAHEAYLELKARARDDASLNPELKDAEFGLHQAQREAMLVLPAYGLYVGPTFLQKPNGGFQEAFELSARFDTGRFDYATCSGSNFSCGGIDQPRTPGGWFRGFFDANYRSSDITDGEENDDGPDPDGFFSRDDGRIRVNAGAQWHFLNRYTDALGLAAGIGFTSPIGDNDGVTENDYERGGGRVFAGVHSHVNYRFGVGELLLGMANDEYWDVECPAPTPPALKPAYCGDYSKRYIVEGSFTLANETASDWSLIGKVSADIPTDSTGRSDVAVSVLLRRDLDGFLKGFGTDE
jgi:hypothetical protein